MIRYDIWEKVLPPDPKVDVIAKIKSQCTEEEWLDFEARYILREWSVVCKYHMPTKRVVEILKQHAMELEVGL